MISDRERAPGQAVLPRWARAADALSLLFVLLAIVVAISGGFRTHFGDLRVTFTSPFRLLLAAIVVTAIRHAIVRTMPVHRDLSATLRAWWREPGVATSLAVLVFTRPAILLIGYLAVFLFGFPQGDAPLRASTNELFNLPVRWDAGWYLQIVTEGYHYVPGHPDVQQNIVFFPAYPALVKLVGLLFGNRLLSYVLAGVVVSLAAWVGALIYLYALARDFVAEDEARYTLWLVGAYPFALFFGGVYTESLFLLAAAGAFYHFTRRQWWPAAAWGFLAGLTRPNGCFLAVALGLLAVTPALPTLIAAGPRRSAIQGGSRTLPRRLFDMPALAAAAAPGIGVLVYSAWIWRFTGNPLTWAEGHLAWGREYTGLSALVTDRYEFIWNAGFAGYLARLPHDFLNALGVIFVLVATWPVYRRLGLAYAAFILINILPPLAAGGLLSAGRFSSVLFPAFIWFAAWVPERHRAGWIASFAAIQALDAILFYTWRPLY